MLRTTGERPLEDAGTVSHKQAMDKAMEEYRRYQVQNLSPVEEAYLDTIRDIEKKAEKGSRKQKKTEVNTDAD